MDLPVASDELIESRVLEIRGHRVILDEDIAALYGVDTGQLVRAVLRNADRFPSDFMFRLTNEEFDELRRALDRHTGRGGRRHESKHDQRFAAVFEAIRQLMATPERHRRPIGFTPPD